MANASTDKLNAGLMVVSFVAALLFPFELFLLAYAILGPLHYLTEINWLDKKRYFVSSKRYLWLIVLLALIVTIPVVLDLPAVNMKNTTLHRFFLDNIPLLNVCFFLAIGIAAALIFVRNQRHLIIAMTVLVPGVLLVYTQPVAWVWFGIFLPTVIHVYLFTLLFMWYGNLKSHSRWGYVSLGLMVLIPVLIFLIEPGTDLLKNADGSLSILSENGFIVINRRLGDLLGTDGYGNSFLTSSLFIKIQIFIAFAYTYHYLNWFSKTTVIGWHKQLTSGRTILIGVIWIASVALYWYDYTTGLTVLFLMSILHVFLEFPLNIVSVKGIVEYYKPVRR